MGRLSQPTVLGKGRCAARVGLVVVTFAVGCTTNALRPNDESSSQQTSDAEASTGSSSSSSEASSSTASTVSSSSTPSQSSFETDTTSDSSSSVRGVLGYCLPEPYDFGARAKMKSGVIDIQSDAPHQDAFCMEMRTSRHPDESDENGDEVTEYCCSAVVPDSEIQIQLHNPVENGVYVIGQDGVEGMIQKIWDNRVATQDETTRPGEWCFCATEPTRTEIVLEQGEITIEDSTTGGKWITFHGFEPFVPDGKTTTLYARPGDQ